MSCPFCNLRDCMIGDLLAFCSRSFPSTCDANIELIRVEIMDLKIDVYHKEIKIMSMYSPMNIIDNFFMEPRNSLGINLIPQFRKLEKECGTEWLNKHNIFLFLS